MIIYESMRFCVFFFNDTATTEIYTLSLHDALPISRLRPPSFSACARHAGASVGADAPGQRRARQPAADRRPVPAHEARRPEGRLGQPPGRPHGPLGALARRQGALRGGRALGAAPSGKSGSEPDFQTSHRITTLLEEIGL